MGGRIAEEAVSWDSLWLVGFSCRVLLGFKGEEKQGEVPLNRSLCGSCSFKRMSQSRRPAWQCWVTDRCQTTLWPSLSTDTKIHWDTSQRFYRLFFTCSIWQFPGSVPFMRDSCWQSAPCVNSAGQWTVDLQPTNLCICWSTSINILCILWLCVIRPEPVSLDWNAPVCSLVLYDNKLEMWSNSWVEDFQSSHASACPEAISCGSLHVHYGG